MAPLRGLHGRLAAALIAATACLPASAHGFGPRYNLPIPFAYFVVGAGIVVAGSFILAVAGLRLRRSETYPRLELILRSPVALQTLGLLTIILRLGVLALFFLVAAAGLIGTQDPTRNPMPTFFWILWWVGVAFVCALIGDLWRLLNPWRTLFESAERGYAWLANSRRFGCLLDYPQWLGRWPAVAILMAFAWLELVWTGRDSPRALARIAIGYSCITWAGMFLFGAKQWCARAEAFSIAFGLFGRFAPLGFHSGGRVELRSPGAALRVESDPSLSTVVLVIVLLASVTFDGFLETPPWAALERAVLDLPEDSFVWTTLALSEIQALAVVRTLGLGIAFGVFLAGYLGLTQLSRMAGARDDRAGGGSGGFVFSLIPIAVAYHVAHYFSYFVHGLQSAIPMISDPFGIGWDLFGTADYRVRAGLIGARADWIVAVSSVVIGHIIAVYVAHAEALRRYPDRMAAFAGQIPVVAFMIAYTMTSMWILSQPIIERGSP